MRVLKYVFLFIIFCISTNSFAHSIIHTVSEGETLGKILESYDLKPLWGEKGWVAKAINSNPSLQNTNGAHINPGQILKFQKTVAPTERELAHTDTHEEVISHFSPRLIVNPYIDASVSVLEIVDNATKSKANLYSKLNLGLGLRLSLDLQNSMLNTGVLIKKISFSDDFNKTLEDNDQVFSKIFISYLHEFHNRFLIGFDLSYFQTPHLHAKSTQTIELTSPWVPSLSMIGHINVLTFTHANIFTKFRISYLGESSSTLDSLKSGYGVGLGSGFKYKFSN